MASGQIWHRYYAVEYTTKPFWCQPVRVHGNQPGVFVWVGCHSGGGCEIRQNTCVCGWPTMATYVTTCTMTSPSNSMKTSTYTVLIFLVHVMERIQKCGTLSRARQQSLRGSPYCALSKDFLSIVSESPQGKARGARHISKMYDVAHSIHVKKFL